jgi:pimeloyl-ACP methyl ester carboxylesterase
MDAAFVLSRLMPNADLHIFGNTGHWVQNERPDDFNAVTLTFFSTP